MTIGQYKQFSGFSLIELISVIVLLGVLSVFALGRLSSPSQFAVKGFFDDTVNAVRFAQKLAVSTGCDVQVEMTTAGYQLRRSSTCAAKDYDDEEKGVVINNPANRSNLYENLATGYFVSPATSIVFNAKGILYSGDSASEVTYSDDNVTFTVSIESGAASDLSFTVFGQTGLVNVP
jgi:MSHA pilin protein MshC